MFLFFCFVVLQIFKYSRHGKNWPVAIKKAYKVKEKTIRQNNCLLTRLYISAVHFLILGCCPLLINHILQPPGHGLNGGLQIWCGFLNRQLRQIFFVQDGIFPLRGWGTYIACHKKNAVPQLTQKGGNYDSTTGQYFSQRLYTF